MPCFLEKLDSAQGYFEDVVAAEVFDVSITTLHDPRNEESRASRIVFIGCLAPSWLGFWMLVDLNTNCRNAKFHRDIPITSCSYPGNKFLIPD